MIAKNSPTIYVHAWHHEMHLYLHRLILGAPEKKVVDHINGNGLDNRRINLRIATPSQNSANRKADDRKKGTTSIYKGVHFRKDRGHWISTINYEGLTRYVGHFPTEEAAARGYDKRALEVWGEFARLNFPEEVTP